MAYSTAHVYAYCNTGFSMINTPATPAVLAGAGTVVDVGDINCLSLIGKQTGTIRVPEFNGSTTCDYLKIVFSQNPIDTYWIVNGYDYLSGDTLVLSIVLDAFLTCGGTAGITSLAGYVKRHTVTDDSYGKYDQQDNMLMPTQNLIIRNMYTFDNLDWSDPDEPPEFYHLVLATIDLKALGTATPQSLAITYGDTTTGQVTVPQLPIGLHSTRIYYGDSSANYKIPNAALFDGDDSDVQNGICYARQLGIEDAILATYALPKNRFTVFITNARVNFIRFITAGSVFNPLVPFVYKQVNNKRAIYGNLNTVQIVGQASGESATYEIGDLYHTGETYIKFGMIADGRPHGKPTFFPLYYKDRFQDYEDGLLTYINGLEWNNVEIKYAYSSGSYLTQESTRKDIQIAEQDLAQKYENKIDTMAQHAVWDFTTFQWRKMSTGNVDEANASQLEKDAFVRARTKEMKDAWISTNVVAPQISFPRSESVRDYVGNGFIFALITPTDADIERFDKILTQFGYADAGTPLTTADLTAGLYFSYIEASGVQLKTSIAVDRRIIEAAERQIEGGIRIWKAKPDFSKYNTSNRS